MNRLRKIATHDYINSDFDIVIINGKVYEGESRAQILADAVGIDDISDQQDGNKGSYDVDLLMKEHSQIKSIACAHAQEYTPQSELYIFLETETLKNISIDEAVGILKNRYRDAKICNDESNYDMDAKPWEYEVLANKNENGKGVNLTMNRLSKRINKTASGNADLTTLKKIRDLYSQISVLMDETNCIFLDSCRGEIMDSIKDSAQCIDDAIVKLKEKIDIMNDL